MSGANRSSGKHVGRSHGNSGIHERRSQAMIEHLEPRLLLTAFVVDSFQDSGAGSLRDAITQANASAGADTITFAKGGSIKLLSTLAPITDDLTITADKKVTINGQAKYGIFSVTGDGTDATFVGLALTNGLSATGGAAFLIDSVGGVVTITGATISKMTASGSDVQGGAIAILDGTVTLKSSTITSSTARSADGAARGGAIYNAGDLTIQDGTKITKNVVLGLDAQGGGIFNDGDLRLTGSFVDSNKALGVAGGKGLAGEKGANGTRGDPGSDGEAGQDGSDGTAGSDGGNASGGGIYNAGSLDLVKSSVSQNAVTGGKGGDGGNGGAGGRGGAGGPGYSEEGERYPGGLAGESGSGGSGGDAGSGGQAFGGGIFSDADATLSITGDAAAGSTIAKNAATAGASGKSGKGGAAGGAYAVAGTNGLAGADATTVDARGGGIVALGDLTIAFATITKNAVSGFAAQGGGIAADAAASISDAIVTMNKVTATGNGANGVNGFKGINGLRGDVGSDGEDGSAGGDGTDGGAGGDALGGGVYASDALAMVRSVVSGNTLKAGKGGNGGSGGAGGRGGAGGAGYSEEGEHFPGGLPGYGGSGGNGGAGGDGGDAMGAGIFGATPDASNTIANNLATAGLAGKGGKAGSAGGGQRGDGAGVKGESGAAGAPGQASA